MPASMEAAWFAPWSSEDVFLEFQDEGLILRNRWKDVSVPMPGRSMMG